MSTHELADYLKREMLRREWTQSDFARKLDRSPSVVSRWLGGQQPTTASCDLIADVFNVDPDVILALAGHRPRPIGFNPDDPAARIVELVRVIDWERTAGMRDGIVAMLEKLPKRAKGDG